MSSLSLAGRISRYYKLTPTRFFASAAARREKYGGGGVHKFRLARRRAEWRGTLPAGGGGGIRRLRGLWSGVVVSALASINAVNLHRARLVLRWATVFGFNSQYRTLISV